jgi:hypothetical protein
MKEGSRQTLTQPRKPMADFTLYDAQDNAFDAMTFADQQGQTPIYNARGCDYEFDLCSSPDRNDGTFGVVVYCFNANDEMVWTGSTSVGTDTRIIDAVRAARNSSNL